MAEKKASIVAGEKRASVPVEKRASVGGEKKKSSTARASLAGAGAALEGDAASALGLTPEEALAAKEAQERLEIRALPVRQYLEACVVPLLLHGLQLLAIERPENPVDFLAKYLIEKNSMTPKNPLKEEPKKEEKKGGEVAEKKEGKKEEKTEE